MIGEAIPCPFCGKPADIIEIIRGNKRARCNNDNCPNHHLPTMTLEDWNTRPREDALQAEIDRLQNGLESIANADWKEYQNSWCVGNLFVKFTKLAKDILNPLQ